MWNRNFNNLIASHLGIKSDGYKDGGTQVKDYEGLAYSYTPNYYEYYNRSGSYSYYYYAFRNMPIYCLFAPSGTATTLGGITEPTLAVGCGTDPESYDDYAIKEIESQGHIGYWNTAASFDDETRTWSARIKRVLVNNSDEDVTISEVGLFTVIATSYNVNRIIMVQRKLLDEPITVKPGAFYSVTMDVSYKDKHDENDGTVRNFDNMIVGCLKGVYASGYADGYNGLKRQDSSDFTGLFNCLMKIMSTAPSSVSTVSSGNTFGTIDGGTGTNPNDYDDYGITRLSGQTYITSTVRDIRYDKSTHSWISTLTKTLTNNSGAPITISEIGLYAPSGNSSISISGGASKDVAKWSTYTVLIQRKLLDTPLTVPDGAMYTISMDVRFSEQR